MTDYNKEQREEIEALRSIYTSEEFTELYDHPYTFEVKLSSASLAATVTIQFVLPETYPDTVPLISITKQDGLSDEQVTSIGAMMNNLAAESVSMVMVFTLVSALQDKLLEYEKAANDEIEKQKRLLEEEKKRKEEAVFHGTTVTLETFLAWREEYEKEFECKLLVHEHGEVRLTGRQMFERDASLALSDARFLNEDEGNTAVTEEPSMEAEENMEVDESLFQNFDDVDVDAD